MERTSSTSSGRRSLNSADWVVASWVALGGDQEGARRADEKGVVLQPPWRNLAAKLAGGVSLDMVLEACRVAQSRASLPCWEEQQVTLQSCGE